MTAPEIPLTEPCANEGCRDIRYSRESLALSPVLRAQQEQAEARRREECAPWPGMSERLRSYCAGCYNIAIRRLRERGDHRPLRHECDICRGSGKRLPPLRL